MPNLFTAVLQYFNLLGDWYGIFLPHKLLFS